MAWVVGETGRVVAIEKVPVIAWLTIEGLREREFVSERFTQTMRRVDARCADYNDFLPTCADDEFDVVYFDPVFHRPVEESESMKDLRDLAHKGGLTAEAVAQALRVARRCVVIKQRQETPLWKELGVTEIHGGPQSRVEYGVLRP
jgi:16S rRNA G966 N2-methylase RsmD